VDLYLIRHADALPLGELGINDDAERPITERGKAQSRVLAAGFRRRAISLGLILTSPLVRAKQTAEEMLRHWSGTAPELRECEELAPGGKPRKLARTLRDWHGDRVALVGHEPDLGELAGWFIGSRKSRIDFAKAGVAYIHCEKDPRKGEGTLLWLVTPEWLADSIEAPANR
jgi:phosphohistidine phosphatase